METFGEWKKSENLTRWQGTGAHASWALNVLRPGPYSLTVEYACDLAAEGAEWQIEAASDRLVFVALDTGMRAASDRDRRPRMRYRAVEKGVLHLARPGRQTLRLSPRGAVQGQGIWVTQLTLMPWV
jgi:hypothetical protein